MTDETNDELHFSDQSFVTGEQFACNFLATRIIETRLVVSIKDGKPIACQ